MKGLVGGVIDVATVTAGNRDRGKGRDGQTGGLLARRQVWSAPGRL